MPQRSLPGLICGVIGLSHGCGFVGDGSKAVGKGVARGRKKTDS
jgi:hypothetical protein